MATRLEDANRLVEIAAQSSTKTYCLPFLWTPEYEMAMEMIASGDIGRIVQLRARTAHDGPEMYYVGTQRIFDEEPEPCVFVMKAISEHGALFDMGVYSVAALTGLAGSAVRVTGAVKTLDENTEVDDTASVLLEMECGAIAVAETTWRQATSSEEIAVLVLFLKEHSLTASSSTRDRPEILQPPPRSPLPSFEKRSKTGRRESFASIRGTIPCGSIEKSRRKDGLSRNCRPLRKRRHTGISLSAS